MSLRLGSCTGGERVMHESPDREKKRGRRLWWWLGEGDDVKWVAFGDHVVPEEMMEFLADRPVLKEGGN